MMEREQIEQTIAQLEAQRATLGDAVVDASTAALRKELAALDQEDASRPTLGGERKLVTVMFADISGFTALAETMDPEAVRELMNACFNHLVPVVEKYEGTVDKFIGDEIMALFGAPVAHENDPERSLRAALEMVDVLAVFNARYDTNLGIHFGINTGLVIAGGMGSDGRQEYSVMGDAVNLAARLEEVSERGEVLVGPDTYRLAAPLFEFESLEPVQVKGKAKPVAIYRVLAPRAEPGKVRGIAGLESPLVGRETEFRVLQEAVERLQAGVGGIVTLVGEAGLGKSRLVAELREKVPHQLPSLALQWVEGRCLSYGTSIAYLLWLDVLRALMGVTAEDSPVAVHKVLREQMQALCPQRFEIIYPYLGRLLSLPLGAKDEATLRDLEGERLKMGTFQAVENLIEGAARRCPVIVVCEDLHWADPTSIELLEQLLPLTERIPLLLICIFRPEKEHGCWRIRETAAQIYSDRHTDLRLDPLSAIESGMLVGNLLQVEALPQELWERILSRAEGNPFYVEELIRSLIDDGAIVCNEATGRWVATRDVADIAIPDTLHGVLMARIDRLQEETKRVLQLASVIGRLFFYRILAEIAREERQLDTHLLTLQREEMIRERARGPELEYIFKHQLTQEAAYNGLLKKERRAFHRQVAEALERRFPERVTEQVGLLAYHWERAEDVEKATRYLLRAGDQARLAYTHAEAIDYYERALAFLKKQEEHERAARTSMKLGLTYHNAFDFQRSRQAYEEGFVLWQQAGETQKGAQPPPAPHALRERSSDPPTLDPTMATDSTSFGIISQMFSGLVELSLDLGIVPDVARDWEVSKDGRKYVFHLRDDARWSDGTPVTAGDFEYAWKRMLDPAIGSPMASIVYAIKGAKAYHQEKGRREDVGVQALDEVTLVVELEEPTGYILYMLSTGYPVPRHVVEAHGQAWTKVENIIGNGPFKPESWQPGQSMVFSRNLEYRGQFTGNLQQVELGVFPYEEWSTGLKMYEAGNLDTLDITHFPPTELDGARQRYASEYVSAPELGSYCLAFDVSRLPFNDSRVRRAFVLATNREAMVDRNFRGHFFPATGGFIPPGMPGHSAGIGLPYDPDQARQLVAEAGYPNGHGFPTINLLMPSGPLASLLCRDLQAQWRENLGIEVTWETLEWGMFLNRLNREPPHLFSMAWMADYPDPDNFLRVGLRFYVEWQNETYQRLVEEASRVMDQAKRMRLYGEADRILIEEAVILPLAYGRKHLLVQRWVTKYPISTLRGVFWKDVIIEPH